MVVRVYHEEFLRSSNRGPRTFVKDVERGRYGVFCSMRGRNGQACPQHALGAVV